jgi:hypothetical protein
MRAITLLSKCQRRRRCPLARSTRTAAMRHNVAPHLYFSQEATQVSEGILRGAGHASPFLTPLCGANPRPRLSA